MGSILALKQGLLVETREIISILKLEVARVSFGVVT